MQARRLHHKQVGYASAETYSSPRFRRKSNGFNG